MKPDPSSADNLELLRHFLLGEEQEAISRLRERCDRLEDQSVERIARDLAEALRKRTGQKADFADFTAALQPGTEAAIRRSVGEDKSRLASALYPIMGPAIRSYVQALFRDWLSDVNETIRNATSLERMRWRVQAKLSGQSYSEYVLSKTRAYEIEEVYWMERDSGLLLAHVSRTQPPPGDEDASVAGPDLMSGMFTAIRSFVRDSFRAPSAEKSGDQELREFSFGDREVLIEDGPGTVLAAVSRGVPPPVVREKLRAILEDLHGRFQETLSGFDGETQPLGPARTVLEGALLSQEGVSRRKPSLWRVWLVALLLFGGLGFWIWQGRKAAQRWQAFIAAVDEVPGVEVLETRRQGWFGPREVIGLRDPLAAEVEPIARQHGQENVVWRLRGYQAAEEPFVEKRQAGIKADYGRKLKEIEAAQARAETAHGQALAAAEARHRAEARALAEEMLRSRYGHLTGVKLEFPGEGGVRITGEAVEKDHREIVAQLSAMKSLGPVDASGFVDITPRLIAEMAGRLRARQLAFMDGEVVITDAAKERIREYAQFARELNADAAGLGRRCRFHIVAHPLIGQSRAANREVERQRSVLVRERLILEGIPADWMDSAIDEDLSKAGSGVTVTPELLSTP